MPRLLSVCVGAALLGCAAPGEPTPPRPLVPQPVTDLAARQAGDAVVLTFTLPKRSVEGQPLAELPAVEIYRGTVPPGAAPEKLPTQLAYTIPAAVLETYLTEGHARFFDPQKTTASAGEEYVYMVRTRASQRTASADSNIVAVRVYPVPEPIQNVQAKVTETAIELSWSPPAQMSSGAAQASLAGYRVYRAEVAPGAEAAAAADAAKAKLAAPLELLGPAASTEFRDTRFEFGRTYLYSVRSVAQYGADSVESADSRPLVLTPRDTFPPAAPQGLVAVVLPATPDTPAHVELSWAISPETDLAGYHVYRSEAEGELGQRLTRELLLAPAYRDMSVAPGHHYIYRVTATDRAGNESALSSGVAAELPPAAPGNP